MTLTNVMIEVSLTVVKVLVNYYFSDVKILFTHHIRLIDGTLPKDNRYFIGTSLLPVEKQSVNTQPSQQTQTFSQ